MNNPKIMRNVILGIFGFIIFMIFSNSTFMTIEPGRKGVIFKRFGAGLDKENIYPQGFVVIAPWNKMFIYDVRVKEVSENMDVLSSNGLSISVDVSLRFKPVANKIGHIHDEVGADYL
ncbi:MAG: prohibitin family protein, partial [Bacteroidia bacterium]|nr:prohibitin family protein [Bacteroidia bacterium]